MPHSGIYLYKALGRAERSSALIGLIYTIPAALDEACIHAFTVCTSPEGSVQTRELPSLPKVGCLPSASHLSTLQHYDWEDDIDTCSSPER